MATAQQRFGFALRPQWHEALRGALAVWARSRSVEDEQMAEQLIREPQLLMNLIGEVTVGESYFFRNAAHYATLVSAARRVLAEPKRRLSVWSAGCAAGEEPYSVALALREAFPLLDPNCISLTGTDVSRAAIEAAEAGIYGSWSFRDMDPIWLKRGFHRLPGGNYQVIPEVRKLVSFRHAELAEYLALVPTESLDAVLFRNVSVYLTEDANQSLYEGFARVLRPGGLLFIAPTDMRPSKDCFRVTSSPDSSVFERAVSACTRAVEHEQRLSHTLAASSDSRDPWRSVDELAEHGDVSASLALLTTLVQTHGDSAEFYIRRGRLRMATGDAKAAVDDFRRVLYLRPDDCECRYLYAVSLRETGRKSAARHQLDLIAESRCRCDEPLYSSVQHLKGELS